MFATGHLIKESFTRFIKTFLFRMAQVDQVAVVRQDMPCLKSKFFAILFELLNTAFGEL